MKLYLKIKELRQKRNLTQQELAKLIGVHQVVISEYELGKSNPSLERAMQLAMIFECKLDDLVDSERYIKEYLKELDAMTEDE